MKILSKYMYGGKSTYENGGIPKRPYHPGPKPKKKGEGLSAKEEEDRIEKTKDKKLE